MAAYNRFGPPQTPISRYINRARFPEDIEQDEVQRGEHAAIIAPSMTVEHGHEAANAGLDRAPGKIATQSGMSTVVIRPQRQADAVRAEVVVNGRRRDPDRVFGELHPASDDASNSHQSGSDKRRS